MAEQEPTSEKRTQALLGVLGYAVAITLIHLGHGTGLILALGQPPLTGFVLQSVAMELVFAVGLGAALSWLFWLPRGAVAFPVVATLVTLVVERILAVDPTKPLMWIAPAIIALGFYAGGRALGRRWIWAPPAIALGLFALLIALPKVAEAQRGKLPVKVTQGEAPEGAPDVLFIVMDTVRAMSCSVNGYERPTTPTLESLASEGAVFLDANAPATWSLPAHAALFTGTFPSYNNANGETRFLDATLPTLAEVMVSAGYESYAFSANPHISDSFGLTRGFQHNDEAWNSGTSARNFSFIYRLVDAIGLGGVDDKGGKMVVGHIRHWMDARPEDDRPAFVFVNFLEAHFPFRQLPEEFRTQYQDADANTLREIDQIAFGVQFGRPLSDEEMAFIHQPLVDLYDGGVQYTDHLVGQVIDLFRDAGRLDNTIVVVLADHGEVVGEHKAFGHVTPVCKEDFRVPLVYRFPKKIPAGTRVTEPVSSLSTFATLLDLADLPPSPLHQVKSLTPAFGPPLAEDALHELGKPLLAERYEEEMLASRFAPGTANGEGPLVNPRGRYRTLREGDYKLVFHCDDGYFLYNLAKDPGELYDVKDDDTLAFKEMKRAMEDQAGALLLPDICAPITPPELPEMTHEEKCALCGLGYMSGPECEGC